MTGGIARALNLVINCHQVRVDREPLLVGRWIIVGLIVVGKLIEGDELKANRSIEEEVF